MHGWMHGLDGLGKAFSVQNQGLAFLRFSSFISSICMVREKVDSSAKSSFVGFCLEVVMECDLPSSFCTLCMRCIGGVRQPLVVVNLTLGFDWTWSLLEVICTHLSVAAVPP